MDEPKQSETSAQERLLRAGEQAFRTGGFGGSGVDGLARAAGLTSGAFYANFDSKAAAFEQVVAAGFVPLISVIREFQAKHGRKWLEPFVDFYLIDRCHVDLSNACVLPTLTIDVARARPSTIAVYQSGLSDVIDALSAGFRGDRQRDRAMALMSILVGAALMARALPEGEFRIMLLEAAGSAAKAV